MKIVRRGYELLVSVATKLQSAFLLVVRVYWGYQFAIEGWNKLTHIQKPLEYVSSLGIPLPAFNAWLVSFVELIGGALLILGLGSRLVALALSVDMTVAYIAADRETLKSILSSDPSDFFKAAEFSFLCAALVVLFFGPGKFSLDYLIERRMHASLSASAR